MRMKRMTIVLDDTLVEKARQVSGERTYTAAIAKALEEYVRKRNFWDAYKEWEKLAHSEEGVFDPEYIKEKTRKSLRRPKQRISAHETRMPRNAKAGDGSR